MSPQLLAQHEFQALLGHAAIDNTLWQDVHRFISTTLKLADEVWQLQERDDVDLRSMTYHRDDAERAEFARHCDMLVQQLISALGTEEVARCAAAALLHPQCWQPAYDGAYQSYYRRQALAGLVRAVAEHCVGRHRPRDWAQRLGQRLYDLCAVPRLGDASTFADCIDHLLSSPEVATDRPAAAILDALTVGDWQQAWQAICSLANRPSDVLAPHIGLVWEQGLPSGGARERRSPAPTERIQDYWQSQGGAYAVLLLARAEIGTHAGQPVLRRLLVRAVEAASGSTRRRHLEMPLFRRVLEAVPESLPAINHFLNRAHQPYGGRGAVAPWAHHLTDAGFIGRLRQLEGAVLWGCSAIFVLRPGQC